MQPDDIRKHYERLGLSIPPHVLAAIGCPGEKPKRRKYNNQPTDYGGRRYDSKHEADRAWQLDLLLKTGEIRGWIPQVAFYLPADVKYVADFVVLRNDGTYAVEDAKSDATRKDKTYRLKKRQMKECLGIEIVEV